MKKKPLIGLILTVFVVLAVTGLFLFPSKDKQGGLTGIENWSYDLRLRLRGAHAAADEIVILGIDEESLAMLNKRMVDITRHDYATAIRNLSAAEARVIAVDVLFTRPTPAGVKCEVTAPTEAPIDGVIPVTAPTDTVPGGTTDNPQPAAEAAPVDSESQQAADPQGAEEEEAVEWDLTDPDQDLAAAIQDAKNVILARYVDKGVAQEPLEIFQYGAQSQAIISLTPDSDNVVRSLPLIEAQTLEDGTLAFYRSLGFEAVAAMIPQGEASIEFTDYGSKFGNIPLYGELGNYYINYVGPSHTFKYMPFARVLLGDFKPEEVKGKIIFIANTHPTSHDFYSTPFDEKREAANGEEGSLEMVARQMPGIEVHANVAQSLLNNAPLRFLVFTEMFPFLPKVTDRYYSAAFLALIGFLVGYIFIISSYSVATRVTVFLALAVGYSVAAQLQYNYTNLMLQVAPYLTMFTFTFVGGIVYHAVTEGAEKARITRTFGQYVSPQVVAELVADPAKASLGGEKKIMTVMFSDIRGFTTMSEKLDPVDLVNFLNEYLTAMTDIVFQRGGVVDKYMGDAIMAFWGAPIDLPDHAKRACLTALDMMTKLKEMQAGWVKRQLPPIDIGIGLNTGPMTVGNMGSAVRFDYTVMGDSVNLASRLEGINKEYGTNIVISEFTRKAIPEDMVTRELDLVAVKGKKDPVRIFELVAVVATAPIQERISLYMTGLQLYKERRFVEAKAAFESVVAKFPDDGPSKMYIDRCDDLAEEPPPEVWDGVFVMKTK